LGENQRTSVSIGKKNQEVESLSGIAGFYHQALTRLVAKLSYYDIGSNCRVIHCGSLGEVKRLLVHTPPSHFEGSGKEGRPPPLVGAHIHVLSVGLCIFVKKKARSEGVRMASCVAEEEGAVLGVVIL